MEAVVKHARTTRHPWLVACDANMVSQFLLPDPPAQKARW